MCRTSCRSNGHDHGDLTIKEACDAAGMNTNIFFAWLICIVSMQQFGISPMAGRGDSSGHCVADSEISVIGPVRHSVEAFAKEGLLFASFQTAFHTPIMTHMHTKPLQALCEIDVLASSADFWQFEDERPVQPVKINSFSEIRELVSQHLLISGTQRE